jgi:FixJ family two-component response regulator
MARPADGEAVLAYLHSRVMETAGSVAAAFARSPRTTRIAIVDDEPDMAAITSELLEEIGYSTVSYTTAVDFMAAFMAAPDRIDLVVTDVVMPGTTGLQLVESLRQAGHDVPVLFMTGFELQNRLPPGGTAGRISFVRKPFTSTQLAQAVRRLVGGAR